MSAARAETRTRRLAATSASFACHVRPRPEVVHVVAEGELDLATVADVEQRLGELRDAGFDRIVLDLRELTFIDLCGLRLAERWTVDRDDFAVDVLAGAAVQHLLNLLGGWHGLRLASERPGEGRCPT